MPIFSVPAGHSWFKPSGDYNPPKSEAVCGERMTDDEIIRQPEVGRIVEYALGVLINSSPDHPRAAAALETARAFFTVRNNDPKDGRNRRAALRLLGL